MRLLVVSETGSDRGTEVPKFCSTATQLRRRAREHVRAALIEGWPLFLTYAIIGVPYGVVAREAGPP